jgi:hypothetical protein
LKERGSLLFVFVAPLLLIRKPLENAGALISWSVIISVEVFYFFLLVLIFRLLKLNIFLISMFKTTNKTPRGE